MPRRALMGECGLRSAPCQCSPALACSSMEAIARPPSPQADCWRKARRAMLCWKAGVVKGFIAGKALDWMWRAGGGGGKERGEKKKKKKEEKREETEKKREKGKE